MDANRIWIVRQCISCPRGDVLATAVFEKGRVNYSGLPAYLEWD
jgi:hypothetical protein